MVSKVFEHWSMPFTTSLQTCAPLLLTFFSHFLLFYLIIDVTYTNEVNIEKQSSCWSSIAVIRICGFGSSQQQKFLIALSPLFLSVYCRSGSHLNVLSVTSTDHAGELASCGRMLRRSRNAGEALFVLDTGISESSGHSSALSSPRSTPSSIG